VRTPTIICTCPDRGVRDVNVTIGNGKVLVMHTQCGKWIQVDRVTLTADELPMTLTYDPVRMWYVLAIAGPDSAEPVVQSERERAA
jgi:hypothetical protein